MDQDSKAFLEEKFASVDRRFDDMEKVFDRKVDRLAEMVQTGFTDASDRVNVRFDELDSRFRTLELSLFTDYNDRIEKLEQSVEKLKIAAGLV